MAKNNADVVVVGGGPIGAYAAWKFAEKGVDVLVLESQKGNQAPSHIGDFHFDRDAFDNAEIPLPEDNQLICKFPGLTLHSPNPNLKLPVDGVETWALDLNGFIRMLRANAKTAGARIEYGARVAAPVRENGRIAGVKAKTAKGVKEYRAPIVVDASGCAGVIRKHVPAMLFPGDDFAFNVYMEYWSNADPPLEDGIHSYVEHQSWTAKYPGYWIVGMGRPFPLPRVKELHKKWGKSEFACKKKVERRVSGVVPYAFSPPTFVDDGVLLLGDAAGTNKPFNGEGIASGMLLVKLAAEVIADAVRAGGTRSSLWEINRRYNADLGAKFAFIRAMGFGTMSLTPAEQTATFEMGLATAEDMRQTFTEYAVKRPAHKWIGPFLRLASRPRLAAKFMVMTINAAKISAHVRNFPPESTFALWNKKYRDMAAAISRAEG